ncbi:MAG: hypothetical protein IKB34_02505, partial [Clostridia bacterium]|nr:hypothetical protein [Clostridia bacterium]
MSDIKSVISDLIEKGRSNSSMLSQGEVQEAVDEAGLDFDQTETIYEMLEENGIEVSGYMDTNELKDIETEVGQLSTAED